MDKYYGNVCELDIIFSFTKAYYILDEILLAGELQESSKKNVLRCIGQQDSLEDMEVSLFSLRFSKKKISPVSSSQSIHPPCYPQKFPGPFSPRGWSLSFTDTLFYQISGRGRSYENHVISYSRCNYYYKRAAERFFNGSQGNFFFFFLAHKVFRVERLSRREFAKKKKYTHIILISQEQEDVLKALKASGLVL